MAVMIKGRKLVVVAVVVHWAGDFTLRKNRTQQEENMKKVVLRQYFL